MWFAPCLCGKEHRHVENDFLSLGCPRGAGDNPSGPRGKRLTADTAAGAAALVWKIPTVKVIGLDLVRLRPAGVRFLCSGRCASRDPAEFKRILGSDRTVFHRGRGSAVTRPVAPSRNVSPALSIPPLRFSGTPAR